MASQVTSRDGLMTDRVARSRSTASRADRPGIWAAPARAMRTGKAPRGREARGGVTRAAAVACSVTLLAAACGANGGSGDGARTAPAPTIPSAAPHGRSGDEATGTGGSGLAGKVIVIDPGHNGGNAKHPEIVNKKVDVLTQRKACDTTGTTDTDGYPEHAFTWDVAKRLEKVLRARGAKVILTRPNDHGVGPCITKRAAIGNEAKADAAVSVHADGAAAGEHGFHMILPKPIPGHTAKMAPDSRRLGFALRDSYKKSTGMPYSTYRGEKAIDERDDLGGLNLSTRPKVFIECGNMKNPGDSAKLSSGAFRQRIADGLADGFAGYFR
jgi:N-acetylmuramoyl-L-alanine amidase